MAGNGMMARRKEKWNMKIAGIADEIDWIMYAYDQFGFAEGF